MANNFVKIINGNYAKIPNGTVGKIVGRSQTMGLTRIDLAEYGRHDIWTKNLVGITEKEYFIKVLQGNKSDKK